MRREYKDIKIKILIKFTQTLPPLYSEQIIHWDFYIFSLREIILYQISDILFLLRVHQNFFPKCKQFLFKAVKCEEKVASKYFPIITHLVICKKAFSYKRSEILMIMKFSAYFVGLLLCLTSTMNDMKSLVWLEINLTHSNLMHSAHRKHEIYKVLIIWNHEDLQLDPHYNLCWLLIQTRYLLRLTVLSGRYFDPWSAFFFH